MNRHDRRYKAAPKATVEITDTAINVTAPDAECRLGKSGGEDGCHCKDESNV